MKTKYQMWVLDEIEFKKLRLKELKEVINEL